MNVMKPRYKVQKTSQRKRESVFTRERKREAQGWLRAVYHLGQPTVIQVNDKGFYFVFPNEDGMYFLTWEEHAHPGRPDLQAAKVLK